MINTLTKTNNELHTGVNNIKDRYFKSILTYFAVAEAKETGDF